MFAQQSSPMNPENVGSVLGGTVEQMETQLYQQITDVQASGDPSPMELATLQMNMNIWETVLSAWSSIIKAEGDTAKQICNNMGS